MIYFLDNKKIMCSLTFNRKLQCIANVKCHEYLNLCLQCFWKVCAHGFTIVICWSLFLLCQAFALWMTISMNINANDDPTPIRNRYMAGLTSCNPTDINPRAPPSQIGFFGNHLRRNLFINPFSLCQRILYSKCGCVLTFLKLHFSFYLYSNPDNNTELPSFN